MKFYEYPKFFAMILKMFITDSDFYKYFSKQGFAPSEWPDCDAKGSAIDFYSQAQEKSLEFAKIKFKAISDEIPDYPIPDSANELICLFDQMKTYGLWTQAAAAIQKNPFDGFEIISRLKNSASNVQTISLQETIESEVVNHLTLLQNKTEFVKVINKFPILSKSIGGFNPARVSIVAAGSGVGKTTLALNLAIAAIETMPVLFVNMEMSPKDFVARIIQLGGSITSKEWLYDFNESASQRAADFVSKVYQNKNFFYTDGRAITKDQLCNLIFEFKEKHHTEFIIVDYDQKIRTQSRLDEWMTILMTIEELEQVAIKTETYILVLAQGDENNNPKASKRSIQPCSSVLAFYHDKELDRFFIESKKNRFEKNFKLEVACDFSKYQVKEIGLYNEVIPLTKNRRQMR